MALNISKDEFLYGKRAANLKKKLEYITGVEFVSKDSSLFDYGKLQRAKSDGWVEGYDDAIRQVLKCNSCNHEVSPLCCSNCFYSYKCYDLNTGERKMEFKMCYCREPDKWIRRYKDNNKNRS